MISELFNSGAMPALERLVQFTGVRHQVLTHNIANLSTPHFRPTDLDPEAFQASLRGAIERRRRSATPHHGRLELDDTRQLEFEEDGITVRPTASNENILFHDRNNRDLDRTMQDLAENTLAHSVGLQLIKSEFDLLKMAIRERL